MAEETSTTSPPSSAEAVPDVDEDILADLGRLQLVDVTSGVRSESRESAEEFIHRQTNVQEGQRFGRARAFARRIWQGNIARDYYLRREELRAEHDIVQTREMYVRAGGTQDDHIRAMAAEVKRFTSEFEGMVREGESQAELSATEHGRQLIQDVQQLIDEYSHNPGMSYDALVEARTRIVSQYGSQVHEADRNQGLMYADNILEIAANARAAVEHGLGLERLDQAINEGQVGEARMGAVTEFRRDSYDKALDWLHKTRVGSVVNESTLGIALAAVMTVKNVTLQKAGAAAGATIGLGVGAAGIAALRERTRVKDERQIHLRQRAEGAAIPENARHREQMEQTRYETISAESLITQLQSVIDGVDPSDQNSLAMALTAVSTAEIYTNQSDTRNIDLIEYSSKTTLEEQRFNMLLMLAQAKVALQGYLDASSEGLFGLRDVDQLVDHVRSDLEGLIQGDVDEKDQAYIKIRNKRMLKMGAVAFVAGTTLGLAYQEIHGLLDSSLAGIGQDSHGNRQTLIEGLYHSIVGQGGGAHHLQPGPVHEQGWNNATFVHHPVALPDGYKLVHARPGEKFGWDIVDSKGHNALDHMDWDKWKEMVDSDHNNHHIHHIREGHTGIGFDEQGNLDHDTRSALTSLHWNLNQHHIQYNDHHLKQFHHKFSPHHYVTRHPKEFVPFHRELWYDNNTPNNYDLNELREYWGGNGTGTNANGDYVLNVGHMLPGWSFHDSQAANAPNLIHEGKMYIALSMSKNTQHFAHFFQVNQNGEAIIPKGSPDAQAMFETTNGHARFIGGYAEAVQVTGHTPDGGVSGRMLATVVGENHPRSVTDTVTRSVAFKHHHFVTALHAPENGSLPVEVPPVIPIYSRRGLEALDKGGNVSPIGLEGMYYGGNSLPALREWVAEDPTRLRTRREVIEADGTRRWIEADGSDVERSVKREREEIQGYLDRQKARDENYFKLVEKVADSMAPMDKNCRVTVNVPAWMEGKNLRRFLDEYTKQTSRDGSPLDIKSYEINILVNRKTGSEADDSIDVLNKFVIDFEAAHGFKPKVNYYDTEVDPPNNNVGYARKLLTDAVLLRSLRREDQDKPLYIESEDADMLRIDPHTIVNLTERLDNNPHLDAARGVQDRAPEYLKDNDYLFIRRRAWDFFEIFARDKRFRDPTQPTWNFTWNRVVTGGWNTGYSAEAYALIDGYDIVEAGEDMRIGEKITMVRGDGNYPNLEVVGTVSSRSDSSPRGFINEIITGRGRYEDFSNEEDNRVIRERSIEEALEVISKYDRITPENQPAFAAYINNIGTWTASVTPNRSEAEQLSRRLMFWLGFKKNDYAIRDDLTIDITNWDNIKTAMDQYRERHSGSIDDTTTPGGEGISLRERASRVRASIRGTRTASPTTT